MDKRNKYKREKKEGDKVKPNTKKCPFCGKEMRARGAKNSVGTIFWKCKNKSCGRTVDFRKEPPKEVIPLTYKKTGVIYG